MFAESSDASYHISAGTAPWALACSVLVLGLYFVLMFSPALEAGDPCPGTLPRQVAFALDFIFVLTVTSPVVGFLMVIAEWSRTGVFAWSFERTIPAGMDWLLEIVIFLFTFLVMILYYSWPTTRRKPSPGACIVGYMVVTDEGVPLNLGSAVLRLIEGSLTFTGRKTSSLDRSKGKLWPDKVYGTHAAKLK